MSRGTGGREGAARPETIPELLGWAAERFGAAEAVVDPGLPGTDGAVRRVGFAELADLVRRAAGGCLARGVRPGDRVAVWGPNTLEWIVAALGALTAGAALVPLNTRFKGEEAAYILDKSGARFAFVSPPFLGNDYAGMLPGRDVVVLDELIWDHHPADPVPVAPTDTGDVIFTSGTTGRPKGVVTTHAQTLRVFTTWADVVGLVEGDRYLVVNPFFHTFGYKAGIVACLLRGATVVPQPVFDVPATLALVGRERITVLPGPPTLYQSILDAPGRADHDLSSLRLAVTGAAVVPVALVERMRSELTLETVLTAYGLTEATGTVTMCRRDDDAVTIATTSGRAIPDTEVRVVGPGNTEVPVGEPGEVVVRGYNVMQGYFDDPESTAETIDADGWLHTGDIGVLDEGGNLRITDRLKDMYVVGGFNAYPAEIEQVLATHPARGRVRRRRRSRRAARRGREGLRRDPPRGRGGAGRARGLRAGAAGQLQGPARGGDRRQPAAQRLGQGAEVRAPDVGAGMSDEVAASDAATFRTVLGHFPTGVAVVTGRDTDGNPAGMAVGSFTSVSLDPPLVAFMPDRSSTSWPRFRDSGSFCVNILGAEQESVCRAFAMKGGDKFADLAWKPAGSGSPILDGVLAWIDCDTDAVHEAGDHFIVIGRVRELDIGTPALPLVFFQGGYGRFASLSLAAWESDLAVQMRSADLARPHMEALATELDVECVASAVVGEDMVLVARAGALRSAVLPTAVGQRIPFVPPLGTAFAAWASDAARDAWLARLGKEVAPQVRETLDRTLEQVRAAGYSVGRGHRWHSQTAAVLTREQPDKHPDETSVELAALIRSLPADTESPDVDADDIRTISTPVRDPAGAVVLVLSVTVAGRRSLTADLPATVERLREAAAAVTTALEGEAQP